MIVDIKTDELLPCLCGFKPDHYSIAYGSTPYDVFCPNCKKQFTFSKYAVTGNKENAIHYWNNYIRLKTIEEIEFDYEHAKGERKAEEDENYCRAKVWQWYWSVNGEELIVRW